MPIVKVTKTVVEKLVKLCETYESGVLGEQIGWCDLENVCGMPYQTLGKHKEIYDAFTKAKKALRARRAGTQNQPKKPILETSEMEESIIKLQAEKKMLEEKVEAYEQRFTRWLFNASSAGIDPESFERDIPTSLNHDLRKRGSLNKTKK